VFAILTGDIINYKNLSSDLWLKELTKYFESVTTNAHQWSIYRGDEFQILVYPNQAIPVATHIKALLQNLTIEKLNARIAIGIGEIENLSIITKLERSITHCRGNALERSGRLLDKIKISNYTLLMDTGDSNADEVNNLLLKSIGLIADNWTNPMSETALWFLSNRKSSNKELAEKYNIAESTLSSRKKRANLDFILEILAYFEKKYPE